MNTAAGNRPTAEDEAQLLEAIERWVEKEVRPIARKMDQADEYPHDLVEQMKDWVCSAPPSRPNTVASDSPPAATPAS
jgi:alkylation response protein AidB-like acyl-CoA dehydrogenase